MQIFASSPDPTESAMVLDDARVRKMVVETAQLLSTAARILGCNADLYKSVAQGKALWTWATQVDAFDWLCQHGRAFCAELDRRKLSPGKFVRTREVLESCWAFSLELGGSASSATGFINATRQQRDGVDYTWHDDTHEAYKLYLRARWLIQSRDPRKHLHPRWSAPAVRPGWALGWDD